MMSLDDFSACTGSRPRRRNLPRCGKPNCAKVPEFSESGSIITGLLLPIWDRLPSDNIRVYRFEADGDERIIGRLVTPEALARVYEGLGVDGLLPPHRRSLTAVIERGAAPTLTGGLQVRRSLVMSAYRVELTASATEIGSGALEGARPHPGDHRLAPAAPCAGRSQTGPAILAALPERHPLLRANSAPRPEFGDVPCSAPQSWRAPPRATPRPCAVITCRTGIARAATGSSAM